MVSTFVLAQEDAQNNSRLEATGHAVAPAIRYDRGLAHHFPPADDDSIPNDAAGDLSDNLGGGDVDQQHVVDLTRCGADPKACLAGPSGDVYPLIIRLETITEKGIKAGHTLDELVCGAAQQSWVQSQTTFAALVWEPAPSQRDTAAANGGSSRPEGASTAVGGGAAGGGRGTWSVRVLKQKIWVEGVSYELQEIYGLEQAAGRSSGGGGGRTDDLGGDDERMCVICLVTPRDTTVLPCRHLCLCHMCAQEWRRQSSKCPICRVNVESLLRIRMKERERAPATTDTA
jgi:E3 ubiquitin-protein ligase MGRN1